MIQTKVYFNNSATSYPKAPGVSDAVKASLDALPIEQNRSGFSASDTEEQCRMRFKELITNDGSGHVFICQNATHALNMAIFGAGLKRGQTVLTTAVEHNSALRPLFHLKKDKGIRIVIADADSMGRIDIADYQEKLKNSNPALIVINHASNVTGAVNDVEQLLTNAKKRGITTILDASQSAGQIKIENINQFADMITVTGHKSLLGPSGIGALYINESIELKPYMVGGTGVKSISPLQPNEYPYRMEAGTKNSASIAGMLAALEWRKSEEAKVGADNAIKLISLLSEGLLGIRGVRVIEVDGVRTATLSFIIDGMSVEESGYILEEGFGIICRSGLHCAPLIHGFIGAWPQGTLRFSLSRFSTNDEIHYAIDSVKRIAKNAV